MSVKLVLRTKPKADGTMPLCIRITRDYKSSHVSLGYYAAAADWDATGQRGRKSCPNSTRFNNLLLKKLAKAADTTLGLETQKDGTSSKTVKNKLKLQGGVMFAGQADLHLSSLKAMGKYTQLLF